jgi:replicative DNA helicase
MNIQESVLTGILKNKDYAKKCFPYISHNYFSTFEYSYLFKLIKSYAIKYKAIPTKNTLLIELSNQKDLTEDAYQAIKELIDIVFNQEFDYAIDYFIDETEKWCKQRALHNSIMKSVEILEENKNLDSIPEMMRKALSIQFDYTHGTEFLDDEDILKRYDAYHKKITKFSTGIDAIDKVTCGGFEPKSVTCLLSGTNQGKTQSMIALGANFLRDGHDVLYVTLEMAEEKIAQRFESNFFDIEINDVAYLSKDDYLGRFKKLNQLGRLVVKEYPTASINVNNLRALLDDLDIKKKFKPKVIILDYLNLMTSSRYSGDNMYTTVKAIAEEVRGMAVEKELCILTATQGNRETNDRKNTHIDLKNVAESNALSQIVDCMFGLIYPEDLREQNIQVWTILKNRFGGIVNYKFPIKTCHEKAQIFDHKEEFEISGQRNAQSKMDKETVKQNKRNGKLKLDKAFAKDVELFIDGGE